MSDHPGERTAAERLRKIVGDALQAWDNDHDSRVGKLLAALAGRLPGYRADIDALHAALRASSAPPEQTDANPLQAYRAEVSHGGCEKCGAHKQWDVVGPDDVAESTTFDQQDDAESHAESLSDAYRKGFESGLVAVTSPPPAPQGPDVEQAPSEVQQAIRESLQSPCLSKRGVAIFNEDGVIAVGHNYRVGLTCTSSAECKADCRKTAVHAEQVALLRAGPRANGAQMVHVKTVDGQLVPSGGPSCVECSKLAFAAGITRVWLFHESGWTFYGIDEFHRLSLAAVRAERSPEPPAPSVEQARQRVLRLIAGNAWPLVEDATPVDALIAAALAQGRSEAQAMLAEWQALDDAIRATLRRVTPSDKARDICGSIEQLAQERDQAQATLAEWLESQSFYELAQVYRHTPFTPNADVVAAFDAMKAGILAALKAQRGTT